MQGFAIPGLIQLERIDVLPTHQGGVEHELSVVEERTPISEP